MISILPLNKQCVFWKLGRLKVWQIQEINFPLKFSRVGRMLKMPRDTVRISKSKSFFIIWNQSHFPKVRRISVRLCGEIKVEVIDWNKHCSWIRYYFIFAFITRFFYFFFLILRHLLILFSLLVHLTLLAPCLGTFFEIFENASKLGLLLQWIWFWKTPSVWAP